MPGTPSMGRKRATGTIHGVGHQLYLWGGSAGSIYGAGGRTDASDCFASSRAFCSEASICGAGRPALFIGRVRRLYL
eukprot:scaffold1218_cov117-Isochrysis_galbana.AAC.5